MKVPIKWLKEYVDLPEIKVFTDKMSMIGHMLDKLEQTENGTVVDLELRGNRADCYSILGIARESHASFGGRFDIPKVSELPNRPLKDFKVEVKSDTVQRFYSAIIRNVEAKPSPDFIQQSLRDYGIEPINILVDVTNYVMIESGMPMHAFDLNRMNGNKLILRHAQKDEPVVTFDGGTLKLSTEDTVFANEKGEPMGIAGVIGGKDSGIHVDTKDILIECAAYDRVSIRKSMFRHNAQTEAGLRHSHELHASLCDYALKRAVDLVMKYAATDKTEIEGIDDYYPNQDTPKTFTFDPKETERLGGVYVDPSTQAEILRRLEFGVEETPTDLIVTVPLFRTDIFESADIVEEVLRIWGYENIPGKTLSSVIPDPVTQKELVMEEHSRDVLTALGLNEVITVPFLTLEEIKRTKDELSERAIGLINPPTSDHTHLRTNMFSTLLDATKKVLDRGDDGVSFFEVGKIYLKKDKKVKQHPHKEEFPYMETRKIAGMFASKVGEWDFYKVKGLIEKYLETLEIANVKFVKSQKSGFGLMAEIQKDNVTLGYLGILDKTVTLKNFDIKQEVFGFELDIEELVHIEKTHISYAPFSEYPAVKQDMSVLVSKNIQAGDILDLIEQTGKPLIHEIEIGDVYAMDDKKSLLFKLSYQLPDRTLSSDEVNMVHLAIEDAVVKKFNAVIRGREENGRPTVGNVSPATTSGKIIVGEVLSVEKHPDADRLVVCKVKVGDDKVVQIVTGAPNVVKGKKYPVALPGTAVPGLKDDKGNPVVMKVAKLRGVESEGMMLAQDELGIGTDHEGLYTLSDDAVVGSEV